MGQKGEPFTDADLYMAARHAAKYSAWAEMTSKDRWEPFAEKVRELPTVNFRSWSYLAYFSLRSGHQNHGRSTIEGTRMVCPYRSDQ